MKKLLEFFKPAPHMSPLPRDRAERLYPKLRWAILESTFIGYAVFYFVRNNLSVVKPALGDALRYSNDDVGNILAATAICYGVGKFLMGSLSDRSNPRKFMPFGLLLTAGLNFAFGSSNVYEVHFALWALNGLVQGMGWPPCGRSLGHWYSLKERGSIFGVWNVAHNVGGGLIGVIAAYSAAEWGWRSAFYVPGVLAVICAIYLFIRLRDTPQSVGLPSVEEYKNDYPIDHHEDHEKELSTRELFFEHIMRNKFLWLFACANFFVYIARYSMLDWGPAYLNQAKQANLQEGGWAVLLLEFGGIPSTILIGWFSDRLQGRRGMVSLLCMIPIFIAFLVIKLNPPGYLWLDLVMLSIIGFFVYPPVMLLGVAALDLTSKKAVGTAAGFVGLFGYAGRTAQAKGLGWISEQPGMGWDMVLDVILASTVIAILLLAFTWRIKPRG